MSTTVVAAAAFFAPLSSTSGWFDLLGGLLVLTGAVFSLAATIGLRRFSGPIGKVHASAKPQTISLILMAIGTAIIVRGSMDVGMILVVAVIAMATAPVAANRMGSVILREDQIDPATLTRNDLVDPSQDSAAGPDGEVYNSATGTTEPTSPGA